MKQRYKRILANIGAFTVSVLWFSVIAAFAVLVGSLVISPAPSDSPDTQRVYWVEACTASWCPQCQKDKPVLNELDNPDGNPCVTIEFFDTGTRHGAAYAVRHNIKYLPTYRVLALSKNGWKEIARTHRIEKVKKCVR